MNLELVTDAQQRRFRSHASFSYPENAFYESVKGIELLAGKQVLEVGAAKFNLHDFIVGNGGVYHAVGFEAEDVPGYLGRDFFSMSDGKYDLIISNRVFERDTLREPSYGWNPFTVATILEHFDAHLLDQGSVAIRSLEESSMFRREQVEPAGFQYQQSPDKMITLMRKP